MRWLLCFTLALSATVVAGLDEELRRDLEDMVDGVILLHKKVELMDEQLGLLKAKVEQDSTDASKPSLNQQITELLEKVRWLEAARWTARSCEELRALQPTKASGKYRIDPDGVLSGEEPIDVFCNMTTGATLVSHDAIDDEGEAVDDCVGRGCFQRDIAYRVPMRQLVALTRISKHCGQSFELQFNCADEVSQWIESSWWLDRRNMTRRFFSCVQTEQSLDSKCSISSCVDHSNSDLLPITRLNLGRRIRHVDAEVNVATPTNRFRLGQFECSGRAQGERGEPGPVGPAGARGPSGRSSKSCPRTVGNGSTCSRVANFGCYCIVQLLKNWNASNRYCNNRGMELVSIETAEEWKQLVQLLRNKKPTKRPYGSSFWTSGSYVEADAKWSWTASGEWVTFTRWQRGQPDNKDGNEHLLLVDGEEPFEWWDLGKVNPKNGRFWDAYFICES